jgi:hypothetical protein
MTGSVFMQYIFLTALKFFSLGAGLGFIVRLVRRF